ncbi:MAG: DnaJ domain-containing protein [Thermoanaerobaculia bacterium]|nr:DnaJ domain-containing protein [Thermoanaerobaculia bacterium]
MRDQAEISYLTLTEAFQDVFLHQRTGVLQLTSEDRRERLLFLGGQLYLSRSNPGGIRLAEIFGGPEEAAEDPKFDAARYLQRELDELITEVENDLGSLEVRDLRFESGLGDVPDDLVGPLPTAPMVMDLYGRGWSFEELLSRLGGRQTRYRTTGDPRLRERIPNLDAGEIRLLERLRRPASIRDLLDEAENRLALLCQLIRLAAVGLVQRIEEGERRPSGLSGELLAGLSERVRRSLEEKPLTLEPQQHRAQVGKLLSEYGRQGFYQLLDVDGAATAEDVHRAYLEKARLVHPTHADALGMGERGRKLEWLFGRLTEAYLVLSDPERAAEYRRRATDLPSPQARRPTAKARRSEQVKLARERYRLALEYIEQEDYFYAIELLKQAARADERSEYLALLANCQMQNPRWLNQAADTMQRALALRPDDEELRAQLEEIRHRLRARRDTERARQEAAEGRETERERRLLDKLRRRRE